MSSGSNQNAALSNLPDELLLRILNTLLRPAPPRRPSLHSTMFVDELLESGTELIPRLPVLRAYRAFNLAMSNRRLLRLFTHNCMSNITVTPIPDARCQPRSIGLQNVAPSEPRADVPLTAVYGGEDVQPAGLSVDDADGDNDDDGVQDAAAQPGAPPDIDLFAYEDLNEEDPLDLGAPMHFLGLHDFLGLHAQPPSADVAGPVEAPHHAALSLPPTYHALQAGDEEELPDDLGATEEAERLAAFQAGEGARLAAPALQSMCATSHVRQILRLAGKNLRHLRIDCIVSRRVPRVMPMIVSPALRGQRHIADELDPSSILNELLSAAHSDPDVPMSGASWESGQVSLSPSCGRSFLESLSLCHSRLCVSLEAANALLSVLCVHSETLRKIHIVTAETRWACALLQASGASYEEAALGGPAEKERALDEGARRARRASKLSLRKNLDLALVLVNNFDLVQALPVSLVPIEVLRLPEFSGGYHMLAALLATYGPHLRVLEISSRSQGIVNLPAAPPPKLEEEDVKALWAAVTAQVQHLEELSLGELTGPFAHLGVALIRSSRALKRVFLKGISGQLQEADCYAMQILTAMDDMCPCVAEVHMIQCVVIGNSEGLFRTLGTRLRSFTGSFSWETTSELVTFVELCPKVERLSLRCGTKECQEGALYVLRTLGSALRSLAFSNTTLSPVAFAEAFEYCSSLEDLELVCEPNLNLDQLESVLGVVGGQLRTLTLYGLRPAGIGEGEPFEGHAGLLEIIGSLCPRLEAVAIPYLGYEASMQGAMVAAPKAAFVALREKLPFLDFARCDFGLFSLF